MTELEKLKDELLTLECGREALDETLDTFMENGLTEVGYINYERMMKSLMARIEILKVKVMIAALPKKKKFLIF